ncbi:MAG: hypothetical protein WBO21_09230 [Acidimicrobiia bacterium]
MKESGIERLIARIAGLAGGKALVIATVVFVPLAVWLFAVVIPSTQQACGAVPLDMRAHYGATEVTTFLSKCGSAGTDAYRTLQIVDLVYPAVSAVFLFIAIAVVMRRLAGPTSPALLLAIVPIIGGLADYAENAIAWMYLTASPSPGWGDLMGIAATAKTVAGWLGGITLLAGLVVLGSRWAARRLPITAGSA